MNEPNVTVIVTVYNREKYIEEGFTDYLPKPFRYKDLNKILEKYMGQ